MLNINEYLINKNTKAKDDELYLSIKKYGPEKAFAIFLGDEHLLSTSYKYCFLLGDDLYGDPINMDDLSLHVFRHESSFIRFFTKLKDMEVPEIIFTNSYEKLRNRIHTIRINTNRKLRYPDVLKLYDFDDKLPIFSEPIEKYMKAENISKEELIKRIRAEH
jgi:hypothetical protein